MPGISAPWRSPLKGSYPLRIPIMGTNFDKSLPAVRQEGIPKGQLSLWQTFQGTASPDVPYLAQ